jgi:hypothetical protein
LGEGERRNLMMNPNPKLELLYRAAVALKLEVLTSLHNKHKAIFSN